MLDVFINPTQLNHIATMAPSDVHVWSASLELTPDRLGACDAVLAPDERQRARRFRFEKDQRHFIAARGVLRHLLAAYLGVQPASIRFEYGKKGKPEVAQAHNGLRFNISHSYGRALWAFAIDHRIGVDLEWTQRDVDVNAVAQRFFSVKEWQAMKNLSVEDRKTCFFNCWTRKEAFVKALGDGLTFGLGAFDVGVFDDADISRIDGPEDPCDWTLKPLALTDSYAGAVAFDGQGAVILQDLFEQ